MTPEQEEQVARALAETARHEPVPPVPAEVAARLDGVLADLVAARGAGADPGAATHAQRSTGTGPAGASVDELSARRRRRRPMLLTAAAAAVLVAAAGTAIATRGFGGTSASDSATSAAGGSSTTRAPAPEAAGDEAARDGVARENQLRSAGRPVPLLRTSSLARDVRRVLDDEVIDAQDRRLPRRKALTGPPLAAGGCARPTVRSGERVLAVRLDGRPATLLIGAVRGTTRSVRVYSCGDADAPVASATVPLL